MLSYLHAFHAGGFGDVVKHSVLVLLLEALRRKDAPFAYLETHAGAGVYDLASDQAQKTGEHLDGAARVWGADAPPEELAGWTRSVAALNPDGVLRRYPGSPRIARALLRPQDRMILCELHPAEHPRLRSEFAGDRQVAVHHVDGFHGLKAFVPPKENRGLVLVDPSYEVKSEYERVADALVRAHRHWSHGVFAIWYPVLAQPGWKRLLESLQSSGVRKILRAQLDLHPQDNPQGMNGTGMLVVNPPWRLDEQLRRLLPWLWERLATPAREGGCRVDWLVPE